MATEENPAEKKYLDPLISSGERTALPTQEVSFPCLAPFLFLVQSFFEYTMSQSPEEQEHSLDHFYQLIARAGILFML